MEQMVSITSQGQLTIPKRLRDLFGIRGAVKALVRREGDSIMVKPAGDFWSLGGSLRSRVKLSDRELKAARGAFAERWGSRP